MTPTFKDFALLYDYSLWEKAVQAFFCDPVQGGGVFVGAPDEHDPKREEWCPPNGQIAFFTAFEAATLQRARPRVSISPISYRPYNEKALVRDANGRAQNRAWDVPLEFTVITKNDYAYFTSVLAQVRAIISQMMPVAIYGQLQTTGLNPFLTVHELSKIWDAGNSLNIGQTIDKGAFVGQIKYNATFAVQDAFWPGGINNA
jgi:hypothetical protein